MRIKVDNFEIGDECPTFIIAEMGANHNGSIEMAKKIIDKAKWAGANAVKIQTWQAEKFISLHDKNQEWLNIEYLKKYEFKLDWLKELINYCKKKKIILFSTPADYEDCDILEKFNTPLYKWGGVQITDHPKLKYVASKGRPIILSTGGSTIEEIKNAVKLIENTGNKNIIILQCTTIYPCDLEKVNLNVILKFKEIFPYPIGFSGHTLSIYPAIASVALGACVVEKHITIDRNLKGPDHSFAMEPNEFKMMIEGIRSVEKSLGSREKLVYKEEKDIIAKSRRSIITQIDISKGTKITQDMLDTARPATGIQPTLYNFENKIPGKIAKRDIKAREVIKWDMINDGN
ncbi:MAG: N-acetylneuraminate synthase family protein [Promethearchaeota archaeon]